MRRVDLVVLPEDYGNPLYQRFETTMRTFLLAAYDYYPAAYVRTLPLIQLLQAHHAERYDQHSLFPLQALNLVAIAKLSPRSQLSFPGLVCLTEALHMYKRVKPLTPFVLPYYRDAPRKHANKSLLLELDIVQCAIQQASVFNAHLMALERQQTEETPSPTTSDAVYERRDFAIFRNMSTQDPYALLDNFDSQVARILRCLSPFLNKQATLFVLPYSPSLVATQSLPWCLRGQGYDVVALF